MDPFVQTQIHVFIETVPYGRHHSSRFDSSSQIQCLIETVPYGRHHSSRFGSSSQIQCSIETVPYGRHHSSIFGSSQMQCFIETVPYGRHRSSSLRVTHIYCLNVPYIRNTCREYVHEKILEVMLLFGESQNLLLLRLNNVERLQISKAPKLYHISQHWTGF